MRRRRHRYFDGAVRGDRNIGGALARERTGIGQHIDIGLLDVQVACLANQAMNFLVGGVAPVRSGNAHPNLVPYQDFPTSDGYMIIAVGNDAQFARLCAVMGLPDLAADPMFAVNKQRVANRRDLIARLSAVTVTHPTSHWIAALARVACPRDPSTRWTRSSTTRRSAPAP